MKILIIRFMGLGDIASILLPAVRLVRQQAPDAEIDVLTYGAGVELMQLVEDLHAVLGVEPEQWPGDLVPAMQSFSRIADLVAAQGYERIINLDTWFMPCFLARLLLDAGLPLEGNYINHPVAHFISLLQTGQLSQSYFEGTAFLASSYPAMAQWCAPWWTQGETHSYPEFYLNHCCGLAGELDFSLPVAADEAFLAAAAGRKIVALSTSGSAANKHYPFAAELQQQLQAAGFVVWSQFDGSLSMAECIGRLKVTDLLVTVATSTQWLARIAGCPSLMLPGSLPPSLLGAELTVPQLTDCQYCASTSCAQRVPFACMAVPVVQVMALVKQQLGQ